MSLIIPGGHTNATVIGLIVQEIDQQNNVLFQWRSWDHMQITDATQENLLDSVIDYVHGNAIEPDNDGNLLISSRHLDEITKINKTTGAIIWRLGGKNNMFTINDDIPFSHQHDIRRISNGNITFFDNGNFRFPEYSRAAEYSLDETNHIATRVWQFHRDPQAISSWGGNAQRLPNGNTLIAWGGCVNTVTEVKHDGTVVFEGSYVPGIFTYRGYKYDWESSPIGINSENNSPLEFKLMQNYPNPFNPETNIKFLLNKSAETTVKIYDISGKEVMNCFSGFLNSGSHTIKINGSSLSSGVYIYKLVSGKYQAAAKMILIK
ncbi:MAG: aryl-sulfate sulfotransferase [Ignavibacteria bacterium]|nr:aryl-sulfate sulfotransferase [Ignavibacteria bacterium]